MVKMNVRDILKYGGYEILEEKILNQLFNKLEWTYIYKVRFTPETIAKMEKEIELAESFYDYDLHDTWTVYLTDVGFNGHGDLWISIAREEDLTECWDLIELDSEEKDE